MHEQYLDETEVAAALSAMTAEEQGLLQRSNRPPTGLCERLASLLADAQYTAKYGTVHERRRYVRLLEDRIAGADLATARTEPLLDSICYEVTLSKLPTFEHWREELAS